VLRPKVFGHSRQAKGFEPVVRPKLVCGLLMGCKNVCAKRFRRECGMDKLIGYSHKKVGVIEIRCLSITTLEQLWRSTTLLGWPGVLSTLYLLKHDPQHFQNAIVAVRGIIAPVIVTSPATCVSNGEGSVHTGNIGGPVKSAKSVTKGATWTPQLVVIVKNIKEYALFLGEVLKLQTVVDSSRLLKARGIPSFLIRFFLTRQGYLVLLQSEWRRLQDPYARGKYSTHFPSTSIIGWWIFSVILRRISLPQPPNSRIRWG
jgi:hypothetical protein